LIPGSAAIVREGIKAFELNSALFTVLRTPKSPTATTELALPHLGNPISGDEDGKEESPIAIEHGKSEEEGGMVSLASVISVVVAICLAHLVIVGGGLTGARGYAKLQAFEEWLYSVWH
jgi:heme oxygenase (biliverdin-producing, ferredoxin)